MDLPTVQSVAVLIGKIYGIYAVGAMTLAAAVAVRQEYKIWKPSNLPSLSIWGMIKVFWFNIVWFVLCLVGSILISAKWCLQLGRSDIEYEGNQWVEATVARICVTLFVGPVRVEGTEHLPPNDKNPAPVYVANHESQIDVGVVYYLGRRFKWIAKQSVLYLPGVGQIMWLSGHVLIQRQGRNKQSVSNLFEKSNAAVQSGVPMFFFPQGTRWIANRREFKDGAFKVALDNKSTLIPLSIGLPRNAWNCAYPVSLLWGRSTPEPITITVHPSIPVKGTESRDELKQRCWDQIYSVLAPPESTSPATTSGNESNKNK
jgi:lysophosphatidate acyltransferase